MSDPKKSDAQKGNGFLTVQKALERVPGVTDAKVDFDKKTASISFDPDKANLAALTKATAEAGYPSSVQK